MNRPLHTLFAAAMGVCLMAMITTAADDKPAELKVGDKAPAFTLKDDQGNDWKSEEHYGKKIVVVYFYPADMTPGCTKQACGFRDDLGKLKDAGIEVVGVSGDSVKNHQLFKKAHNLTFTLLADPDGEVAGKFGVPFTAGTQSIEREIDGQKETLTRTATIQRHTFVVGKDGKIVMRRDIKGEGADPGKDAVTILEFVKKLSAGG
jgi:peroxiredoxin Q/BCP